MAIFLEPFNEITNLFSGSKYPTANLYMPSVWKIQVRLLESLKSNDRVIRDKAKEMVPKFEKYWKSYSLVLSFAIILDPRYKLEFVRFCYKKIEESLRSLSYELKIELGIEDTLRVNFEEKTQEVIQELRLLFLKYEANHRNQEIQEVQTTFMSSTTTTTSLRDESIVSD